MIKVKLKFFAGIKNQIGIGIKEIDLEESSTSIDDIVKKLISFLGPKSKKALPAEGESSYKFLVFVNSKKISNHKKTVLKNGDNIYLMPPVAVD